MKLIPKNWNEFQQYKDRKPSWIKLHRDLLNDFAYSSVQIGTKATLPLLWLLACEYDDGIIDASVEEIAFRIHIDEKTVDKALKELINKKFFTLVQDCTEAYEMVPREEKRRDREETELEKRIDIVVPEIVDTFSMQCQEIINHLNNVTGSNYKPNSKETKALIKARLNDGFTVEDFMKVHVVKFSEWSGDEKFSKFLRPETLYSKKFEGYLNQNITSYQKSKLIQQHTGLNASEILDLELAQYQKEWEANNAR